MNDKTRKNIKGSQLRRYTLLLLIAWSAMVLLAWGLIYYQAHRSMQERAVEEAHTHFKLDQALRLWVASHGGVYAPVDEQTQPSPFLAQLAERDVQTPSGTFLTLLNPAYVLRQLNANYPNLYDVTSHIVSLEARGPENSPDTWERRILESYQTGTIGEVTEFTIIDGSPVLRLMQPFRVQETCIKCHATQGYQVGEYRGAISITQPIGQMVSYEKQVITSQDMYLSGIWLFGIALIVLSTQRVKKQNEGRLQAENALLVSEERYRALYEDSPMSLWEEDFSAVKARIDELRQNGETDFRAYLEDHPEFVQECITLVKIIDINNATLKLYHAQSKEELLTSLDRIVPPQAHGEFLEELVHIANGDLQFEWEGTNQTLSGDPLFARIHWSALPGFEDSLARVIISLEDVTERRLAEKALRDSEQLFSVFMDHLPAATFIKQNGRTIHANQYLRDLFGWQEWEDKTTNDLLPEALASKIVADDQEAMQQGHKILIESVQDQHGVDRTFETHKFPIQIDGRPPLLGGIAVDLTERIRAETQARHLASKLKAIASATRQITALKDLQGLIDEAIVALEEAMGVYNINLFLVKDGKLVYAAGQGGYEPTKKPAIGLEIEIGRGIIGLTAQTTQPILVNDTSADSRYVLWESLPDTRSELAVPVRSGDRLLGVLDIQSTEKNAFDASDLEATGVLGDQLAIALENAQLFEETSRRAQELGALSQVSAAMRVAVTRADIVTVTLEQVTRLFNAQACAIIMKAAQNGAIHVELGYGRWALLTGKSLPPEWAAWEYVIASGQSHVNNYVQSNPSTSGSETAQGIQAMACVPLISQEKVIGALTVGRDTSISEEEQRALMGIGDMIANAIQRSSLYEQTQRHAEQMSAVSAIGRTLAETLDLQETYARLAQAVQDLYPDAAAVLISDYNTRQEQITCVYGTREGQPIDVSALRPTPLALPGQGTQSLVIHSRKPMILDDLPNKFKVKYELGNSPQKVQSAMYAPLLAKGEVLGLIQVQSYTSGRFTKADTELLMLLANTGAIAIENSRLFGEIKQRVQRLGAVRAMDMAISSSFDLRVTLNVLLDQVTAQLNVDAACVLLYNAHTRTLEYAAGRGFQGGTTSTPSLRIDQSLAGRAALERRIIHFPNLRANKGTRPLLQPVEDDSFVAYYAVPLIAKGQVKGVLEIYNRSPLSPDTEWMEFLETLAGDTAIAVDNTALFNDLQRSNVELTLAYDRTLEGWSHALELRDEETLGHAQRVTDMTVELARAMGMSEVELVHVRRGALLHDIGKMGVPDRILRKPGPLTEEEWEIMRRHPVSAFELLSPIPYLKPSLNIPYSHHERWDGSGYPNGLKGEQIPLAARVFAVVDVWDALLSERPYRAAWPKEEVIAYLKKQAGSQFDPTIVEVFLHLRDQE